jgi:hypothetical protein
MPVPRSLFPALVALLLLAGCFSTEPTPLGVVEVETQGDISIEEGLEADSFADARTSSITFDRFLVHVGAAGLGETSATAIPLAGAPYVLVDHALPGSKIVVTAPDVVARRWGGFTFTVNPARVSSTLGGGVTEEDRRAMQQKGASVRVKGVAKSAGAMKSFDWWFLQVLSYGDCTVELPDSGSATGLLVRPAYRNEVPIVFSGRPLFDPILGAGARSGRHLRFDAFADADVDTNGVITESELRRVKLSDLRVGPGLEAGSYAPEPDAERPIETLWDFVSEQVRHTVRLGGRGVCTSNRFQ